MSAPSSLRTHALNTLDLWSAAWLAAALLGVWHGALLAGGMASLVPSWELLAPVAGMGAMVGLMTGLLPVPVFWLARRLHPRWSETERMPATWAICVGWTVGVMAWMVADKVLGGVSFGGWIDPGLRWGAALVVGGLSMSLPTLPTVLIRVLGVGAMLWGFVLGPWTVARLQPPAQGAPEITEAREGAPDVILVTVDTLRADHLGVYGHRGGLTPALDRLADEGLRFDEALTAGPWTVPSLASIHTGLSTAEHGAGRVLDPSHPFLRTGIAPEHTLLAERFQRAGYRTRAIVANAFISAATGFDRGFDQLDNPLLISGFTGALLELPLSRRVLQGTPPEEVADYRAQGIVDAAIAALKEPDERPLFLWVHLIDPHAPYQADPAKMTWIRPSEAQEPPREVLADGSVVGDQFMAVHAVRAGEIWLGEADRQRLRAYYEGAVAYADSELGRLFEVLRARPERPVVAFTSDHGEELWEHGGFEHGHHYWREITWAPLILWGEGVTPGVVSQPVGHAELYSTLLTLAGLEAEGGLLEPAEGPRYASGNLYDLPGAMVAEGEWRYLLRANGVGMLFHASDRGERRDLSFEQPEVAARMRGLAGPVLEASSGVEVGEMGLGVDGIGGLRALGYVE